MLIRPYDDRRDLAIETTTDEAVQFAVDHWIKIAATAIKERGRFFVALSGGSTPNAIYRGLAMSSHRLNWSKVWLFWGDERAAPPDHPDSNYFNAMQHGLSKLPIPPAQIFRMEAEAHDLPKSANIYEALICLYVPQSQFDLVMLGVGEDGHTASLFPKSDALSIKDRLVAPNWIAEKQCWRMTFTFPCIEQSRLATLYALGPSKQEIVKKVLQAPLLSPFPASRIGTSKHKALWILDQSAAASLK